MDTGGEIIKYSVYTEGDRTGYNMETKENGTKQFSIAWRQRKKRKRNTQVVRGYSPRIRLDTT